MDNPEALQRFEAYLRRRFPDRRTPVDYVSDVRQFQSLCPKTWDLVTVPDIDQFVDHMHRKELKPATITRRVMALKVYFDFLANDTGDLNHPNPIHLHRHAAKLGRHLPHDLSDTEVACLWESLAAPRDRALVALMWRAGLRVAEVVGLTLDDVLPSPTPAGASPVPARLRVLGKGQKERIVYLSHEAYTVLEAWLAVRPQVSHHALFLNERHQPLRANGVEWLLKGYGDKLGLHLTPHRLRHTFARQLIEAQMPVESLASLMGHAQISTTQIYLAGADPAVRETFEQALSRLASPAAKPPPAEPAPARSAPVESLVRGTPPPPPPTEPRYPDLPAGATWATDLPVAIRQACLAHLERHVPHWRTSRRRQNACHVLAVWASFFRFVLERHALTTVAELTREDLRAYVDRLTARGVKANSVRARLQPVLALLRELNEQGEPIAPALLRVERPPHTDVLPRALSESDAQRLEAQARVWLSQDTPEAVRDAACFFLLAHTGIRTCELRDLRQADVDLAQRRLRIEHGKHDQARVVYLTETAANAVRRYLERCPHPEHALLFVNAQGEPVPPWWAMSRLQHLGQAAHVPTVTPHRLRHTLATRLINAEVPITTLQKLLGHRYLSTTQIYARVYDATVERDYRRAMERLEQNQALAVPVALSQGAASSSNALPMTVPAAAAAAH